MDAGRSGLRGPRGRPEGACPRDLARRGSFDGWRRDRSTPLPVDRTRGVGRRDWAARRRQVVARERSCRARAWGRAERRRRLGRSVEPVHARRAPGRPDPAVRPLSRPGGLHPVDGDARAPRRTGRGDAAGAAPRRCLRQGRDLPGDRRHGTERGGGDRDRRSGAARPDARAPATRCRRSRRGSWRSPT